MKKNLGFLVLLGLLSVSFQGLSQTGVRKLKCEYLLNPIGIDEARPRLTWQLHSLRRGSFQKACQIRVGTDAGELGQGKAGIWMSETLNTSILPVVYRGPELQPFTRYFWQVRVQDNDNIWSDWSEMAFFETGMMDRKNWKGKWITDTYDYTVKPAPYFRKTFDIGKPIQSAKAYIAVAGLYELSINGQDIGDHRLDPAYTRYDRRNLYVTYDVTENLQQGKNAIGVLLGNGWYNHQSTAVWYFDKAPWRARPKFCMDLRITYVDGSVETIATGEDWKTAYSPVIFNSIYTAEHYDARLEQAGWNTPDFEENGWKPVLNTGAPSGNITAQVLHPIRNVTEIPAANMKKVDEQTWLFDFGRNIAGVTRIKVSGPEGTILRLKHAEQLDAEGRADLSNIDVHYRPRDDSDPFQTDVLILSGREEDVFMPRFNYKGFRYVEVTADRPLELTKESLTAYFMHSDVPLVGNIHSSDKTLNKIWEAANASYLSNLFAYPTDCPQREKNGWTGDAFVGTETGLYNYDGITVYEKWLADHRDEQQPNGVLPAIIPTGGWGYHWANGLDWTSTIALIPWNIYLFYGDSRLLGLCYENIRRYVDYVDENYPSGLTDWGLGDWLSPGERPSVEFIASAYFYTDALVLSKASKILGKQLEYEKYAALAKKIKKAVNEKYLNPETGIYGSGLQTELSLALYWNLVPEQLRQKVAGNLARRVEADDNHIDVGLVGSKTILNALSQNGYPELAWEVASQETFPSWGWWIVNGATTFYENWSLDALKDVSMNHIMFGEINAWYYKALGGILPDESQPGFKHLILKPHFVPGLEQFEASHEGPYGVIESSWRRKSKLVEYRVSIPPNSSATLYLEGNDIRESGPDLGTSPQLAIRASEEGLHILELGSGEYLFEIR
ncbi:MAG: alpha-rhamnosidase [Bacteroidetes bacterium]|nr:MAG: alpha-rhamnosidase [Bacteroidota bacterium]